MTTHNLRPDMPPLPGRIAALPVDERGYPVPWFVAWVDGRPEFRCADAAKRVRAVRERLCWVCGEKLGVHLAFVLGPMCSITRTTAEPPCHRECAEFSVKACPFLSKPQMHRRENDLPGDTSHPGLMIRRNPGASCVWVARSYSPFADGRGGVLFKVGEPDEVLWWYEGRPATRAEVLASVDSGLPLLMGPAVSEGPDAVAELRRMQEAAVKLFPAA